MTYSKTTWVDETIVGAERFDIKDNGGTPIESNVQIVLANTVSVPGTSVDAANLNKIESGIEAATLAIDRAGGSSTVWATNGTNNYTPTSGAWRIQTGASTTGVVDGGETDITFPVAFAYAPIMIATVSHAYDQYHYAIVYDVTVSQFTVKCIGIDDVCHTGIKFNWIAIGPT